MGRNADQHESGLSGIRSQTSTVLEAEENVRKNVTNELKADWQRNKVGFERTIM